MKLFFTQVQDYGCLLKMDDGEAVLKGQWRLLHVFLMLDDANCREYQRALVCSVLLWHNYKQSTHHECWRMFVRNACAFNEETGEICFSILAKGIASNGVRSDIKQISQRFRLLRPQMDTANDLKVDLSGNDFAGPRANTIDATGPEVQATISFLRSSIRQMVHGNYRHYDSSFGRITTSTAVRPTVPAIRIQPLKRDVSARFGQVLAKVQTNIFNNFWVQPYADIWPAAIPVISSGSDDESLDPSSEGDASEEDVDSDAEGDEQKHGPAGNRNDELKDNDDSDQEPESDPRVLIGRLLCVPARKIGLGWANRAYGRSGSYRAVLHARVIAHTREDEQGPMTIRFLADNHEMACSVREAVAMLVPVNHEETVQDTQPLSDSD